MQRLVVALAILTLVPGIAAAEERCPTESLDLAVIESGIRAAPTCDASLKIFRRCGSGASGDVALGAAVTEKCEAMFEGRLSSQQKRAYSRARRICETRYANQSGSMYRSFEAFCLAQAAHRVASGVKQPERATASK